MTFQQPILYPGTAEYAINLFGPNLTCTHSPKYDLNREQNPRFPSRIAFFHINDQDVSYLDTKKLCVACCAAIIPDGFNVWSLFTTLTHHYQGSLLPKRWLDTEPCISGNDGRLYPRLFEIGKEGRRSGFFQTLPNRIHIPQGFPEANDAWQWLQQQRKPFYIDQIHLAKGWKLASQTAASLDSVIAEKHGLSFTVASAQARTPRHQFGPPPPMRQPYLKPQQSPSPKHPVSPPSKHLHSFPPPKPQHSSPCTNQLPLASTQHQSPSLMADPWPRLQSQHSFSQLPTRKPIPKKPTQNPPFQSVQPLPLPAAKVQQSIPLRKPVNSPNQSAALLQSPLTQHPQFPPLQHLQLSHPPKIEQPSEAASKQASPSSKQVWHFYEDIPLETVSALVSRKATKSSTGSPRPALEQIFQKLLSTIVTPSNSLEMGLAALLDPNPISTDLTEMPRDAMSVITAQIGVPGSTVGGKSQSSRTTQPNSTPAGQTAPRSVSVPHAQQISTGARSFDGQKGIKPKKPQQASHPSSVSAYTRGVNGQSGSVQNTRPPRMEREPSHHSYQGVPASKLNMSVQPRAFNEPQPLISRPAQNQMQRNPQNQQNHQIGRSSQPPARNQLAYNGPHWNTPKASDINQSPSSHVHVWKEPSTPSPVPQTQYPVFSHPKSSPEFFNTPKHWHSQAAQAKSLPQPGTSETSQLSSSHPSLDNSAPKNDAALESAIRDAGTDNASANANAEPERATAEEESQTPDPKHLVDSTPNNQQNATNERDSATTTAKSQPPGGFDPAAKDSTTKSTTSSESTTADAPAISNQLDPTAPAENTNSDPSDPGTVSGSTTQTPTDQRVPEFELPLDTTALNYTPSAQSGLSWSKTLNQPFDKTGSYGPGSTQPWEDKSTATAMPASQSRGFTDDDAKNLYTYTNDTPPDWEYCSHLRSGRTSQHSQSGSTRSRSSASSESLGSSFRSLSEVGRGSSGGEPSQRDVTEYGNSEFHHGQLELLDGPDRDQAPRVELEPSVPDLVEPQAEHDESLAFYDGELYGHDQESEPEPEPGEPDDTDSDDSGLYRGQYRGLDQEPELSEPGVTEGENSEFYRGQYRGLDQELGPGEPEDSGLYHGQVYHPELYYNRVEEAGSQSSSSSDEEEGNHGLDIHDSYQAPRDEVQYNPEVMEQGAAWYGNQINHIPHDWYHQSHDDVIEVPHDQENMAYGQPEGVYGHEHEEQWDHPSPADEGEQGDVPGDSGFGYPSEVEGNEPWEGFGDDNNEHYETNGGQDYGAGEDYQHGDGYDEAYDGQGQGEPEFDEQGDPQYYDNEEQYGNEQYYQDLY